MVFVSAATANTLSPCPVWQLCLSQSPSIQQDVLQTRSWIHPLLRAAMHPTYSPAEPSLFHCPLTPTHCVLRAALGPCPPPLKPFTVSQLSLSSGPKACTTWPSDLAALIPRLLVPRPALPSSALCSGCSPSWMLFPAHAWGSLLAYFMRAQTSPAQ